MMTMRARVAGLCGQVVHAVNGCSHIKFATALAALLSFQTDHPRYGVSWLAQELAAYCKDHVSHKTMLHDRIKVFALGSTVCRCSCKCLLLMHTLPNDSIMILLIVLAGAGGCDTSRAAVPGPGWHCGGAPTAEAGW